MANNLSIGSRFFFVECAIYTLLIPFSHCSDTIKSDNAKRLLYVMKHYSHIVNTEQRQNLLIQLLSFHKVSPKQTDLGLNNCYYRLLRKAKENLLFLRNKMSTRQYDSHIAKLPVYHLISTWFFEFDPQSSIKFSDFMLHIIGLSSLADVSDNVKS